MTTTLPAKPEEFTALQAQASFNDAEKKAFRELDTYIKSRTKDNILWYWDLGVKIKRIHDDAKKNAELYGNKVMVRIAKALGFQSDSQLRSSLNVVRAWGTKKAFNEYLRMKGEAGNILQWTHITYLAGISDEEIRAELAATTLDQCWTAEELWKQVKKLANRVPRGVGGGPSTKIPASARACLTHLFSQAAKFTYNVDKAWTGDAFNLREAVEDIPADKLDEKFVSALSKAQDEVVKLRARAEQMSTMLETVKADVAQRRVAQAHAVEAAMEDHEGDFTPPDPEVADDDDPDAINMGKLAAQKARKKREAAKKKKATKKRPGRVGV